MKKDFWRWHKKKKEVEEVTGTALFKEREIWWCTLGTNIGYEQDGTGELFTRPVVILTKFNLDSCLVVALTAKPKKGKYYFDVGEVSGRNATAILSQLRFVDRKRLVKKISTIHSDVFKLLNKSVVEACLPNALK